MLRDFGGRLRKRRFTIGLWSGVGILLLVSLQDPGRRQFPPTSLLGYLNLILSPWGCDLLQFYGGSSSYWRTSGNIRFEPNIGQADSAFRYVASGDAQAIYLSPSEAVFDLHGSKRAGVAPRRVRAVLEGAAATAEEEAQEPKSGRVNYLIGNDPDKWYTNIPTFGRVTFHSVYPGIDLAYHGAGGNLENDFVVKPGADPSTIRIRFEGADRVRIDRDGALVVEADRRGLRWEAPFVYQRDDQGQLQKIEGRFRIPEYGKAGFEIGIYDLHRPLIIDPVLSYATYFGTSSAEAAVRVATDASGNAYMIGGTDNVNFPVSPGAFATSASGVNGNVLVAKLSGDGKTMIYETHIGGSSGDVGFGIAVSSAGEVYLTGMTGSANYPLVPPSNNLSTKNITDPLNCFVSKLNASGSALVYSTVIGGGQADGCSGIAVDSSGNAYVSGATGSSDFPVVNAAQPSPPGSLFGASSVSAFVAKLNAAGTALVYSTYYGGPGANAATAIAVDSSGNAYFTGFTTSASFPVTSGAYQTSFAGSGGQNSMLANLFPSGNIFGYTVAPVFGDAFVVKLNASGQKVYSTYLGGEKDDIAFSIAVDSRGDAYAGGATLSAHFPVQNAFQASYGGAGGNTQASGGDGFIAELDPSGSSLLFSSYLGGSADDRVLGIALDSSGTIYLAGHTLSKDFPTAGQQAQQGYGGDNEGFFPTGDAFLAEVGSNHQLTFSTYLGGSSGDWASGVAVDGQGGVIVAGSTASANFPVTSGTYQSAYGGSDSQLAGVAVGDAFLAKFGGSTSAISLAGISNAASYAGGAIAPGEAVLIAGSGIGPATLQGAALTASGSVATQVANTQFTFNGVAAPIVYVSQQYSSVIVPYEVAGKSSVQVVATVNGQFSPPMTVNVVPALPGIFSANSSGTGQGAILNQNLTHNSAQNPAARGSTVVLFLTGEGQTIPPGVDGQVTASAIAPALAPVTVLFGGVAATNYAFVGEAPGEVAGLLQINVSIPQLAPSGANVPVTVNIGGYSTQSGITIAIQ
jgi:uncharacterized protein (TIGR03437 family)